MKHIYCAAILIGLFFCIQPLQAQQADPRSTIGPTPQGGSIGSSAQDSVPPGLMPLDTQVPVSYVHIGNENKLYIEKDSFSWKDVRHEPLGFGKAHLGNLGSASRPLWEDNVEPIGFSTGWFQYEPYYLHEETFRYYTQEIPSAKIKFSTAGEEDTYLTLDFGRSFAKGISLSVAYSRINQVGQFFNQAQKDTGLGIGVWHNAPNGRYDAFYNLISNSAATQENGGVSQADSIGKPSFPDIDIPTYLRDGVTNHKHRLFLTKQIFHLLSDSSSFGIDLWAKAKYESGLFKFTDATTAADSMYYGLKYLVEARGIRQFTFFSEHQESAGVSLPWKSAHSTIGASIRYRSIHLEQEPITRNINEVYLDASGEFQWVEPLQLRGEFTLGLGQASATYSIKAFGDLNAGILGNFSGHWYIQSRNPYLIETRLFVNQLPVYEVELDKPFKTEIGVNWKIEKLDFEAGVNWKVLDNYIYFDSSAMPQQLDGSFSIRQLYLFKNFDLKWIGLNAKAIWQPDTKSELALPETLLKGSLFGRVKIFNKKLTVMPGIDITYYSSYKGIDYFPVNGVYHLSGRSPIPEYVRIDAGFGLNINFVKAFIRMEDIVGLFKDRALYQADFYPQYRGYLRFGLEAGFYN